MFAIHLQWLMVSIMFMEVLLPEYDVQLVITQTMIQKDEGYHRNVFRI